MAEQHRAWARQCCGSAAYVGLPRAIEEDLGRGSTICRVVCENPPIYGRCISKSALWCYDAAPVYREFARRHALRVAHLWNAPAEVLQYLKTGDESTRAAAHAAATTSLWDPRDHPRGAKHEAAEDAAGAAARASTDPNTSFKAWDAVDTGYSALRAEALVRGSISAGTNAKRRNAILAPDNARVYRELAKALTAGRRAYGQRHVP